MLRYDLVDDLATAATGVGPRAHAGQGVHTVFDGVGAATFDASLASLAVRGTLALFGGSSGAVPPVDPMRLEQAGSLFLTRPSLRHHVVTHDELRSRTDDVLGRVASGGLDVRIGARFPLEHAGDAHRALEGRTTTGKVLLIP